MAEDTRRKHPRVATDLKINLRTKDGKHLQALAVENISLGGVFVHLDPPLAFGAEIAIDFAIKNPAHQIRCGGCVVWARKGGSADGPAGIGVRLTDISIADMRALEAYIAGEIEKHGG